MLDSKSERAQTVQNWSVETEDHAKVGIDVKRIKVAVETIKSSLIDCGALFGRLVRLAIELARAHFDHLLRIAFASKVATAHGERHELIQRYSFLFLVEQLDIQN